MQHFKNLYRKRQIEDCKQMLSSLIKDIKSCSEIMTKEIEMILYIFTFDCAKHVPTSDPLISSALETLQSITNQNSDVFRAQIDLHWSMLAGKLDLGKLEELFKTDSISDDQTHILLSYQLACNSFSPLTSAFIVDHSLIDSGYPYHSLARNEKDKLKSEDYRISTLLVAYHSMAPSYLKAKVGFALSHYYFNKVENTTISEEIAYEALYILEKKYGMDYMGSSVSLKQLATSIDALSEEIRFLYHAPNPNVLTQLFFEVCSLYAKILVKNSKLCFAIKLYDLSIENLVKRGKLVDASLFSEIASICYLEKEYSKASRYYEQAFSLYINDKGRILEAINIALNLSDIYLELGDYRSSEDILMTINEYCYRDVAATGNNFSPNLVFLLQIQQKLAQVFLFTWEYDKAIEILENMLSEYHNVFSPSQKCKLLLILLKAFLKKKWTKDAYMVLTLFDNQSSDATLQKLETVFESNSKKIVQKAPQSIRKVPMESLGSQLPSVSLYAVLKKVVQSLNTTSMRQFIKNNDKDNLNLSILTIKHMIMSEDYYAALEKIDILLNDSIHHLLSVSAMLHYLKSKVFGALAQSKIRSAKVVVTPNVEHDPVQSYSSDKNIMNQDRSRVSERSHADYSLNEMLVESLTNLQTAIRIYSTTSDEYHASKCKLLYAEYLLTAMFNYSIYNVGTLNGFIERLVTSEPTLLFQCSETCFRTIKIFLKDSLVALTQTGNVLPVLKTLSLLSYFYHLKKDASGFELYWTEARNQFFNFFMDNHEFIHTNGPPVFIEKTFQIVDMLLGVAIVQPNKNELLSDNAVLFDMHSKLQWLLPKSYRNSARAKSDTNTNLLSSPSSSHTFNTIKYYESLRNYASMRASNQSTGTFQVSSYKRKQSRPTLNDIFNIEKTPDVIVNVPSSNTEEKSGLKNNNLSLQLSEPSAVQSNLKETEPIKSVKATNLAILETLYQIKCARVRLKKQLLNYIKGEMTLPDLALKAHTNIHDLKVSTRAYREISVKDLSSACHKNGKFKINRTLKVGDQCISTYSDLIASYPSVVGLMYFLELSNGIQVTYFPSKNTLYHIVPEMLQQTQAVFVDSDFDIKITKSGQAVTLRYNYIADKRLTAGEFYKFLETGDWNYGSVQRDEGFDVEKQGDYFVGVRLGNGNLVWKLASSFVINKSLIADGVMSLEYFKDAIGLSVVEYDGFAVLSTDSISFIKRLVNGSRETPVEIGEETQSGILSNLRGMYSTMHTFLTTFFEHSIKHASEEVPKNKSNGLFTWTRKQSTVQKQVVQRTSANYTIPVFSAVVSPNLSIVPLEIMTDVPIVRMTSVFPMETSSEGKTKKPLFITYYSETINANESERKEHALKDYLVKLKGRCKEVKVPTIE
jgi:tetratricopeptide (TPR) repeat protein